MAFSAEKAAWSGAPEVVEELARQKATCDEGLAQIRSGGMEMYYSYWFGKVESIWRYIIAVGARANVEKDITANDLNRQALWSKILKYGELAGQPETLPIMEEQRIKQIHKLKGDIIHLFDLFYQEVLNVGVKANLFSYQKGGDMLASKEQRIAGVPSIR
jgi:hypothetical protein